VRGKADQFDDAETASSTDGALCVSGLCGNIERLVLDCGLLCSGCMVARCRRAGTFDDSSCSTARSCRRFACCHRSRLLPNCPLHVDSTHLCGVASSTPDRPTKSNHTNNDAQRKDTVTVSVGPTTRKAQAFTIQHRLSSASKTQQILFRLSTTTQKARYSTLRNTPPTTELLQQNEQRVTPCCPRHQRAARSC